jgi:hypothetical protein
MGMMRSTVELFDERHKRKKRGTVNGLAGLSSFIIVCLLFFRVSCIFTQKQSDPPHHTTPTQLPALHLLNLLELRLGEEHVLPDDGVVLFVGARSFGCKGVSVNTGFSCGEFGVQGRRCQKHTLGSI